MHVMQTKSVGPVCPANCCEHVSVDETKTGMLFKIDLCEFHLETGILHISKLVQAEWIVAAGESGATSGTSGVLPLSFGRQQIRICFTTIH